MNTLINFESLIQLSAELNKTEEPADIYRLVLLSLMGKLRFIRGAAFEKTEDGEFKIKANKSNFRTELPAISPGETARLLNRDCPEENILIRAGFYYVLPVPGREGVTGLFLLGGRFGSREIEDKEVSYTKLIAAICSSALANSEAKQTLIDKKKETERSNQLLTTIFDLSKQFSRLLTAAEILPTISRYLMGQLGVTRFALLLYENEGYRLVINRFESPVHPTENEADFRKIDVPVMLDEAPCSTEFCAGMKAMDVKIINPIIISGEKKGIMLIGKKVIGNDFTPHEIEFINALGNSAGAALENEKYVREITRRKTLENEMQTALDIQKGLLPEEDILTENFEISGLGIPARYAAGDYFDYIRISENRYLIIIADVSGKGIPASLLMANLQAALRVLSSLDLPLPELVKQLNLLIHKNTSSEKFITAFLGVLDTDAKVLQYTNAGHNAPLLFRKDGRTEELEIGGLILGFMPDFEYSVATVSFNPGDTLLMYTDGVNEAQNSAKEEYGTDRLEEIVRRYPEKSSSELCRTILEDVTEYSGNADQYDDITLLAIKSRS